MRRVVAIGMALTVLIIGGCQQAAGPNEPAWEVLAQGSMSPKQAAQRDKALAARDAMATRLKGRLMEVIGTEGPAAAIVVCSEEAPQIAADTSREHAVSLGRTSFRLRNPENTPPPWAAKLVADRANKPTYLSSGNRLAALLPIRLETPCLMCHGNEEAIPPAVKAALVKHYRDDQATGFQEGDLRGWFWVEVHVADGF